jgi:hypothetical protein
MQRQMDGAEALRRALERRGNPSYREAVTRFSLDIHWTHLGRLLKGKHEADFPMAVMLEQRLDGDVPVESWPSLREAAIKFLRLRKAA